MKGQSVNYQELEFTIHSESGKQRKSGFASKIAQVLGRIVESLVSRFRGNLINRAIASVHPLRLAM
jgi:hypothetical protein